MSTTAFPHLIPTGALLAHKAGENLRKRKSPRTVLGLELDDTLMMNVVPLGGQIVGLLVKQGF